MNYPLPGSLKEAYSILQTIHEGRNSTVYLVRHNRLHNLWVIKQVFKGSDAEQAARREFELLRSLRHPKLPFVSGIAEDEHSICLIEEYIEGKTLAADLADTQGLPGQAMEQRAITLGEAICDILSYLHSQNPPVLHRDLKPANIMLLPDGSIKLLDFGISAQLQQGNDVHTSTSANTAAGTPGYAAPEQLAAGKADVRADIYSLGATLFEIASGLSPSSVQYALPSLRTVNPDATVGLEYIIDKCTQTDPAARYATVDEVLYDLQNVDNLRPEKKANRQRSQGKRTPLIPIVAAAAVICIAAMILVFTGVLRGRDQGSSGDHSNEEAPVMSSTNDDAAQDMQFASEYEEGMYLLTQEKPLEAIEKFTEALEEEPDHVFALIGRGDAYLGAASLTMTSHVLAENDLVQRSQYYRLAKEDYESADELRKAGAGNAGEVDNTELEAALENRLEALSQLTEQAAIDVEVLDIMQSMADLFENDELETVCELLASSDASRTSYCNIHRVQSILYPTVDKAVLSGWPWTYYGTVENELPSGDGIALQQDRMTRISLESRWVDGVAQGNAVEQTVNLSPTSASGSFFVTRSRSGKMLDGVMDGNVTETLTYKISEESGGKITDFVTEPFEISYTVENGLPVSVDKDDLPDINWRNSDRLESEDVYAWSEEARLLFYVSDYQSYTYTIGTP